MATSLRSVLPLSFGFLVVSLSVSSHEYPNSFTDLSLCSIVATSLVSPNCISCWFPSIPPPPPPPPLTSAIVRDTHTFCHSIPTVQWQIPLSLLPAAPLLVSVLPAPVKLTHTLASSLGALPCLLLLSFWVLVFLFTILGQNLPVTGA